MLKKTVLKFSILISLCLLIASCGFQWRGYNTIPPQLRTMYFTSNNPYGEFEARLKKSLQTTGITLVHSPHGAPVTLQILQTALSYNALSIGASSQATIYSVTYLVRLALLDKNGHTLVAPEDLTSTTNLTLSANQLLTTSNQIELTSQQLQRDIIVRIFDILSSEQVAKTL